MNIVMTGCAGDSGAAWLAEQYEEQLCRCLPAALVRGVRNCCGALPRYPAAIGGAEYLLAAQEPCPVSAVLARPIRCGGLLAALWELAEAADTGLNVELTRIPVRQDIIEVCECLDVMPYQLYSGGWLWFAEGEPAAGGTLIGFTNASRDRTLTGYGGRRFLNRPPEEELSRLRAGRRLL